MVRPLFLLAASLSILPANFALEWRGPRATLVRSLPDAEGFTPRPTNGPHVDIVAKSNIGHKLFRRQTGSPGPGTCGFADGNGAFSITCEAPNECAYNTRLSAFGCCGGRSIRSSGFSFDADCFVNTRTTTCYASSEADSCTGACTRNAQICSFSSRPICRTVFQLGTGSFDPITYTQYDCMFSGAATSVALLNSYTTSTSVTPNPLVDPRYTFDGETWVPTAVPITSSRSTTRSGAAFSFPTTTTSPTPSPTGSDTDNSKSNTGAIAGGVVGGLVAVGLIAGGVIWALKRRKQKARAEAFSAVNEVSQLSSVQDQK